MPIYAYRCEACGFAKDVLQKMSDAPLTDCLSCGKPSFKKQVTAAGFQLKGSGWYATDFRGNGSKPDAAKTGSAGASADATAPPSTSTEKSSGTAAATPAVATPSTSTSNSGGDSGSKSAT